MPTIERVTEIFKEAVKRNPEAKDMLAIKGMANPYLSEDDIKETFEGLYAGEQQTAKILAESKPKPIAKIKPVAPRPVAPKPVTKPVAPKKDYKKSKAKKTTAKAIKIMTKKTKKQKSSKKTKK